MMNPTALVRRRALRTGLLALATSLVLATGTAQAYPDKPVTLYVGFAAGGSADTVARALADELSKTLGQRVNVENRPGASANIASAAVLAAPADGYSLLFAGLTLATNPPLIGVKYDPLTALTMVTQITSVPVLMVTSAKSALKSPADIVQLSKSTPGGLKVGSGGLGTSSHLAPELFFQSQKLPYLHVPYRGGAPANVAMLGGEVDLMFDLMSGTLRGFVEAGQARALAVMQDRRIEAMPDLKSAKEWGLPPSTFMRSWQGIAVKAGTPEPVVAKIHKAVLDATATPGFRARVWQLGSEVVTSKTPAEFDALYRSELKRWDALIKAAGIKVE
jgi:tripartite-type tricarboxylate transporter receptor subunit TctC